MLAANVPARFQVYWAFSAGPSYVRDIPINSQIGVQDGAASLETGFPPLTFQQLAAGGSPPFGQDFNGILRQLTVNQQWQQAGGAWSYDSTFSTSIGGYPRGARLNSSIVVGRQWYSLTDGNTTDPDDPLTSTGWAPVGNAPGTPIPSFSSAVLAGCVLANGLTVGNVASNATGRANADTLFLYRAIWQQFSATACPIYTSAGTLTTRGASPDADFAANKALATPDMKGRGVIGCDTMGGAATARLSGVPFSIGSATVPGSFCGENLHVILNTELASHFHVAGISDPTHFHSYNAPNVSGAGATGGGNANSLSLGSPVISLNTSAAATGVRVNSANGLDTTASTGGNVGHNTVEQNLTVYWNIKL